MSLTIEIPDDNAARYQKLADARRLTVGRWMLELADTAAAAEEPAPASGEYASGMVEENGLLVYRTGKPLPAQVVDDASVVPAKNDPRICSAICLENNFLRPPFSFPFSTPTIHSTR